MINEWHSSLYIVHYLYFECKTSLEVANQFDNNLHYSFERETSLELATYSLEGYRSTN